MIFNKGGLQTRARCHQSHDPFNISSVSCQQLDVYWSGERGFTPLHSSQRHTWMCFHNVHMYRHMEPDKAEKTQVNKTVALTDVSSSLPCSAHCFTCTLWWPVANMSYCWPSWTESVPRSFNHKLFLVAVPTSPCSRVRNWAGWFMI